MNGRLGSLALVFAQLSLMAVGGANPVIPEMQRQLVDVRGWLDGPLFASLVALAQAAPGPNAMVVGLVGWHVGGLGGAAVATIAFCGPPALAAIAIGRAWGRLRGTRLGRALAEGLAPVTVGLVLAAGYGLSRANGFGLAAISVTALVTLGALKYPRGGLWLLASAAVAGIAIG
ncbi:MAG: chromate transporter [Deltaproteobacteria bacterium]|nr:chromate transporter [Deltaproteobacteria bacterium]